MANPGELSPDEAFWAIAANTPDLLKSNELEARLGLAAQDRTILTAELLRRRGDTESLKSSTCKNMVGRVVHRYELPPGSAYFILQRVIDDCVDLTDDQLEEKLRILSHDAEDIE